ncbi:hypothetical protein BACT_0533 [Bifidobacterium actinocoloniiforme DSM 22766]|uniref:Uncharacterized protein n=1 Tax=Bifidobacterium actinocoloniiforme DSM 22766 TaxID=1437605 RepID=A0A086YZY2_9BIFI|nr:hypothetical protein [Bifidobacterium actinocoloniiforme]AKV55110.1 hypothetical protein AB656_01265 [Bifidobacterium actinocoloniiforme DSM 22766]KFI39832.1 hypothetical protein BACT_0533 [Bifidobacterium actinocoloniiforme DSM 22766]
MARVHEVTDTISLRPEEANAGENIARREGATLSSRLQDLAEAYVAGDDADSGVSLNSPGEVREFFGNLVEEAASESMGS